MSQENPLTSEVVTLLSRLSLYAYIIDTETTSIPVENDGDKAVHIPRNCRLGRVLELDLPNAFQVRTDDRVAELAVRKASAQHKTDWFKKVLTAAYTATALLVGVPALTGNSTGAGPGIPSGSVVPGVATSETEDIGHVGGCIS